MWLECTGDSYIVDVQEGYSAGAATYLASYLKKQMYEREGFEDVGIARRWSCNKYWPREFSVQKIVWEQSIWLAGETDDRDAMVEAWLEHPLGGVLYDRAGQEIRDARERKTNRYNVNRYYKNSQQATGSGPRGGRGDSVLSDSR